MFTQRTLFGDDGQPNSCAVCGNVVHPNAGSRRYCDKPRVDLKFCSARCKLEGVFIRFWDHVDFNGPEFGELGKCWVITSRLRPDGYGYISVKNKRVLCHRFVYGEMVGEVTEGLCVLHRCDNPPCVNPDHLFVGTQIENMLDRDRKGRTGVEKRWGEKSGAAVLTEKQVKEIRAYYRKGVIGRGCYVIAKKYKVAASTIYAIVKGEHWFHVK